MPRLARLFIKTGLIYFLAALILALASEVNGIQFPGLVPLFWHLLMVGWITQIIFGVSMWMFPGRNREEGFRAQKWGWLTFIMLNAGLLLRAVAEPLNYLSQNPAWNVLIALSAITQAGAALTYIIEIWPRIQSKEQQRRQRKKKRQQARKNTGRGK
ncbi:Cytochrome C and Quinol oxidase polypeptide I [Fodinibius roseus]|uniref:Cytochrome C and Quinol oxidase polypeptide I n=1 Tax=Fodinibius roseus TaxID=1194090 RepID=A0A1M5ASD0_9BACT|nr:hypothetical protein [Fodinibius roseus]SHF33104.1 Cytochrome C and Quinol oxidase polypeptide I [Fodinibius roseus]